MANIARLKPAAPRMMRLATSSRKASDSPSLDPAEPVPIRISTAPASGITPASTCNNWPLCAVAGVAVVVGLVPVSLPDLRPLVHCVSLRRGYRFLSTLRCNTSDSLRIRRRTMSWKCQLSLQQQIEIILRKGSIMKTSQTLLTMALSLAGSLLAIEAQAGGVARNQYSEGSRGSTNVATAPNLQQGKPNSSTAKSAGQKLGNHNPADGKARGSPSDNSNKSGQVNKLYTAGETSVACKSNPNKGPAADLNTNCSGLTCGTGLKIECYPGSVCWGRGNFRCGRSGCGCSECLTRVCGVGCWPDCICCPPPYCKAAWQQWAEATAAAGKDDEAIAILRRAAAAVPDGTFPRMQAWIYIRRGEDLITKGRWQQAATAVEPGLVKLDPIPQAELRRWTAELPLRWAQSEMQKKDFKSAIEVLERGRGLAPKDERLAHDIVYAVQEWVEYTQAKAGDVKAKAILVEQIKRFPDIAGLKDVAASFAIRNANGLRGAHKYDAALASIDENQDLLKDKDITTTLYLSVFDTWAGELTAKKQWPAAVGVYKKGVQRMPANEHLTNSLVYVMQEWVQETSKSAGQEQARKVLLGLRQQFPKVTHVDQLAKAHVQRVVLELRDSGKFDDALAAINKNKELLKDQADSRNLAYAVYDFWANGLQRKRNWQAAVDIYAQGLQCLSKDDHLTNNAVATWNAWANTLMDAKDWRGAIKVYEKALAAFPENSILKNNLSYCRQNISKR